MSVGTRVGAREEAQEVPTRVLFDYYWRSLRTRKGAVVVGEGKKGKAEKRDDGSASDGGSRGGGGGGGMEVEREKRAGRKEGGEAGEVWLESGIDENGGGETR